jgi:hypothetical protein
VSCHSPGSGGLRKPRAIVTADPWESRGSQSVRFLILRLEWRWRRGVWSTTRTSHDIVESVLFFALCVLLLLPTVRRFYGIPHKPTTLLSGPLE